MFLAPLALSVDCLVGDPSGSPSCHFARSAHYYLENKLYRPYLLSFVLEDPRRSCGLLDGWWGLDNHLASCVTYTQDSPFFGYSSCNMVDFYHHRAKRVG